MERLTEKVESTPIYDCNYKANVELKGLLDKLGQLEDILEKYGITDLEQLDNRLEENVKDFTYLGYGKRTVRDYYNIEQELGIDLITLFKAIEQEKVWTKYENEIDCCDYCEYMFLEDFIYFYWEKGKHLVFKLNEYGKAWALTKEELEDEK